MKYIHRNDGFSDILIIAVKDNDNNRSLRYLQEGDTIEELSKNMLKICNCGKFFPNCYCSIYKI